MHYSSIMYHTVMYILFYFFKFKSFDLYAFFLQVQLNLMAPTRDNYYGNQQAIQGLVHHIYYYGNELSSDRAPWMM